MRGSARTAALRLARAVFGVAEIDGERAADDRLDAGRGDFVGEFQRSEHVVGVGERERRLLVGLGEFGQPRDRERAFQQRIGRVHVQVHEVGADSRTGDSSLSPRVGMRAAQVHRQARARAGYAGFQQGPPAFTGDAALTDC